MSRGLAGRVYWSGAVRPAAQPRRWLRHLWPGGGCGGLQPPPLLPPQVLFKLLLGSAKFGEAALFLSVLGVFNLLFVTCVPVILYFTKVEYWSPFTDIPWGNLCGFAVLLLSKWRAAAGAPLGLPGPEGGGNQRPATLPPPPHPVLFMVFVSQLEALVTMTLGPNSRSTVAAL